MEQSGPVLAEGVREFLHRDHARLDGLLDRFRDEPLGKDAQVRRARWRDFEAALLGHMAAEEKYLFTAFGMVHTEEAASLRAQHAELRRLLAVAGSVLDAEGAALKALTVALRDHARQEDDLLYAWAQGADLSAAEDLIRDISERPAGGDAGFARR